MSYLIPTIAVIALIGYFSPEGRAKRKADARDRLRAAARERLQQRKRAKHLVDLRDADVQSEPYSYQVGAHANAALAIRYGIANQTREIKEFWYYAKGGERKRNPERDRAYLVPSKTIRLRKVAKIGSSKFEVELPDFANRKAIAIIEPGAEYVKTFYPTDPKWFVKHSELELTLKGNDTFTLKELARFHVEKAVHPRFAGD